MTLYEYCIKNKREYLLKDWDYAKNVITPKDCLAHSNTKVSWKCQLCGHEWDAKVSNRVYNGRNCPACTMKSTSFGEQALYYYIKQIFPDAVNRYHNYGIELDVFIPCKKTAIEFDGFFWHNNDASINREKRKYKVCQERGIKLIRIRDSKAIFDSDTCDRALMIDNLKNHQQLENIIRMLLRDLDPESNFITRKNPKQLWSTIDEKIRVEDDRFEILKDKYLREEENSFAQEYPELLKDWDYNKNKTFNPKAFTKYSTINVWWKCHNCEHEWQAKIVNRVYGYKNCPVCSNKLLKEGYNDFATRYPKLLEEWDYDKNELLPNKILKRHNTKVFWKCKNCNYEWIASLGARTRNDKPSGCPQCKINNASLAKHLKAVNRGTLNITNPEILIEWDYDKNSLKPNEITKGSNKRIWWKCKICGYEWQSSPNNRTRKNSSCPKCHYQKTDGK